MFGQNQLTSAVVNYSSSGDNTVVAAVTGRRIRVWKLNFTVAGATAVTVKDGSTAVSGAYNLTANGSSLFFPYDSAPYWETSQGAAFVLNSSNAVSTQGTIYYTTV